MRFVSTYKRKPLLLILSLMLVFSLLLSACGQRQNNTSSQNNSNQQQDSGDTQQPDTSSESKDLGTATMAVSVNTLSFAPIFVAEQLGYYKEEGVDLKVILVDGGGPAVQALVGRSAEFAATDSGGTTQAAEAGVDILAIQSNVNKLTMDFVMANEDLERLGVSREDPIEKRFAALKGLTIGITSAGAATDVFTRYYLNQAGLTPEVDTKLLAIGGGPSLAAALKQGQIDGFMLSPPQPQLVEADGAGKILISASMGDVPGLDNFPYEVINVRKEFAEQNPEVVRAVARALARANNLILDDRETAMEALQKHFSNVEPDILSVSLDSVAAAVPRDGLMNEDGWKNAVSVHLGAGMITKELDTTEGVFWTNEFLK